MKTRLIHDIATEIRNDWSKPYFGAVPYLCAMRDLAFMSEHYGADSAREIVLYFLSNASTWRGETAKRVKPELKSMLNAKE